MTSLNLNRRLVRTAAAVLVTGVVSLSVVACASEEKDSSSSETSSSASSTKESSPAESAKQEQTSSKETSSAAKANVFTAENVHLHDGFVKAIPAGKGMTAIFGLLENHSDRDAHIVGFSTSLGAGMNEIHEVVDGVMREKENGLMIPANDSHELKPGADHLMIMGYKDAIEAGSTIDLTLIFEGGEEVVIKDVPVRTIAAGEENYSGSHEGHDHMNMDDKEKDHDHMNMDDKEKEEAKS